MPIRHNLRPQTIILSAACVLFFSFCTFLKFRQLHYLLIGAFDYALYSQSLWTTWRSHHFLWTSLYGDPLSIIALHTTFFHCLLTPIYALFPTPQTLSIIQIFLFATGAFALFLSADKRLGPTPALFLALAYLLDPLVMNCQLLGYYGTRVFPVPLLLWSLWALTEDRMKLHAILALAAASCDEATALVVMGIGVFEALCTKKRRFGLSLAIAAFAYFIFAIVWIQPHFGNNDPLGPLELPLPATHRDLLGLITYTATHLPLLMHNLLQSRKLRYLFKLFLPVLFTSLFSPAWLLPAVPIFFMTLMLTPRWLLADSTPAWTALSLPFVFFGAIDGVDKLSGYLCHSLRKEHTALALCVLSALASPVTYRLADRAAVTPLLYPSDESRRRAEDLRSMLKKVPRTSSIAAADIALPFLVERWRLYSVIPAGLAAHPDYFLVDKLEMPCQTPGPDPKKIYQGVVDSLKKDPAYREIDARGDFTLYQKLSGASPVD